VLGPEFGNAKREDEHPVTPAIRPKAINVGQILRAFGSWWAFAIA
jgi:hypothetical protein